MKIALGADRPVDAQHDVGRALEAGHGHDRALDRVGQLATNATDGAKGDRASNRA